ncbi:PTS system transporter subunit IIB [Staphylococcus aureus]|nr:PTS system transporter subunit IIB [Staphylococcus aureus]
MKILVVCGHGLGSSFMVEMNAQEALRQLNAPSDIEVVNIATL